MAKKIRKAPPRGRSLRVIFIELLIPWLVMGAVAIILVSVGVLGILAFVVALGAALVTTFYIAQLNKKRVLTARINEANRRH